MGTFALIHGGGDVGWYWHLVERELRARGHQSVAPDLPIEDDDATLEDHARVVLDAIDALPRRGELVVVGHSAGGYVAPIVAERATADRLHPRRRHDPAARRDRRGDVRGDRLADAAQRRPEHWPFSTTTSTRTLPPRRCRSAWSASRLRSWY